MLLLWLLLSPVLLFSTEYYVNPNGNNSNDGLSSGMAWLALQYAADQIFAGDTVYVSDGNYDGFDLRNISSSSGIYTAFIATGENVAIVSSGPIRDDGINVENCSHIIIDGFISNDMPGIGNGIRVVVSDFCIVRNCTTDGNAERGIFTGFTDDIIIENNVCSGSIDEHGIYVSNSSDRPIIRHNICHGNNRAGIHINGDLSAGGDGIITDAQIYNNIIYDNNLGAGINMDGAEHPIIYNNLIYNNHSAQGISMYQIDGALVTHGAKIYHNTIVVPSDGRWGILINEGAQVDTEIYNNIILNNHAWRGCIAADNVTGLTADHNLYYDKLSDEGDGSTISFSEWQALGLDAASLVVADEDLVFSDPGSANYHLLEDSPARMLGTDIVAPIVKMDLEGNDRTAYDAGVYERSTVLSVDLADQLKAEIINHEIHLTWSTLLEENVESFLVEYSDDGNLWHSMSTLRPKGGNRLTHYRTIDRQPLLGIRYYKILELSEDGLIAPIGITSIIGSVDLPIVYVSEKQLFLRSGETEIDAWMLYDTHGHLIHQIAGVTPTVDLSFLPRSMYIIIGVKEGKRILVERIVVE